MKKILFLAALISLAVFLLPLRSTAQTPCDLRIISDFDAECLLQDLLENALLIPDMPTANCALACQNNRVTYRAECSERGSYSWNISGASSFSISSDGSSASILWSNANSGNIMVTFVASDSSSICTAELCLFLLEPPTVGCTSVPSYYIDEDGNKVIEVCIGEDVKFFDQSEGNNLTITGYMWSCPDWPHSPSIYDYGFGHYSTPNCTYQTTQSGEYIIEHRVVNLCGCEDSEEIILRVSEPAELELSCYGTVCANSTAEYSVLGPLCSEYHWIVEGGDIVNGLNTETVTVAWGNPSCGYGTLSLDAFFCETECNSLTTVKIPIIGDSVEVSGPEIVCVGDVQQYGIPRYGSTYYNWQVPSPAGLDIIPDKYPNNCMLRFNQTGIYELYAEYGCDFLGCGPYRTQTKRIIVSDTLCIHSERTICAGDTGRFTTNCPGSVRWEVFNSSGNSIYNTTAHSLSLPFADDGSYRVSASHPDYCKRADFALTVMAAPPALTATEGPDSVCIGGSVLLSGTPTRPDYYLEWRPARATAFPSIVEGNEATFTFMAACDINVYQVDNRYGCRSEAFVHTMNPFQLAPFNTDTRTKCAGDTLRLSVLDQSENTTYQWTVEPQAYGSILGDNRQPSAILLLNIIDADTAYATIRLKRTYCAGFEMEETKLVRIIRGVVPTLTFEHDVCQNDTATFSATGITTSSNDYQWIMDDVTLNGMTVSHTFDTPGQYPFTLKYSPHNGCIPIDITDTVNVSFTPNATIHHSNNSNSIRISVPEQDNVTYSWTRDGTIIGTTSSIQVENNFTENICCTVISTINSNCSAHNCLHLGGMGIECVTVDVETYTQNCNVVTVHVDNPYDSIIFWNTFPITASNLCNPDISTDGTTAQFSYPGHYTIRGYQVANDTCFEYRGNFTIYCIPKLNLRYDCMGHLIIEDKSRYLEGFVPTRHYAIDIDGQTYSLPGHECDTIPINPNADHPIEAVVTASIDSISCTFSKSIIIPPAPAIDSIDIRHTMCANTPFLFSASTSGEVTEYLWDFGDGSTNNGNNIYHTYDYSLDNRHIDITLRVSNDIGCSSSSNDTVDVVANRLENSTLSINPNYALCPGDTVILTYPDTTVNLYYWNFSNMGTRSNTYFACQTENYHVRVVDESNGCVDEKIRNVMFDNAPTARITGNTQFCLGNEVALYGNSGSDNSYRWHVSGPEVYTTTSPDLKFTPTQAGVYHASLTVENSSNCQSVATHRFEVDTLPATPQIAFDFGNYSLISPPVPAYSVNGNILNWSDGSRGQRAKFYNDGFITAHYVDPATGCRSDDASLYIPPAPDFDALLTGCYKLCPEQLPLKMPVYRLFPIDNPLPLNPYVSPIYWLGFWYDTYSSSPGIFGEDPLLLPISQYGDHRLEFWLSPPCMWGLSNLENGRFVADMSPTLRIEKVEECPCEYAEVEVIKNECVIKDCSLEFFISIEITNTGLTDYIAIDDIRCCSGGRIHDTTHLPLDIPPGGTETLVFYYSGAPLNATTVEFALWDCKHPCEQKFQVILDWSSCVTEWDCPIEESSWDFAPDISTPHQTAYYNLNVVLPEWIQNLLGFWCEPFQLSDYFFDGSSSYNVLLNLDFGRLTQMAADGEDVCIYIVTCTDEKICVSKFCIPAEELLDGIWLDYRRMPDSGQIPEEDGDGSSNLPAQSLSLAPNPAHDEVFVKGVEPDDIVSVHILTMEGRIVSSFTGTDRLDIGSLARAAYIVRVQTKNGKAHYLKLVKGK